jgi:hypothetical protein
MGMTRHEIARALGGLQEELNRKREGFRRLGINVHRLAAYLKDLAAAFDRLHQQEENVPRETFGPAAG